MILALLLAFVVVVLLFAWSQPDCRLNPNTAVPTNGTNIYTGQQSSNAGVPGKDSRTSKPTDCRQPGNIPENSRTNQP
jgi:hypothetical protein